MRSAGVNFDARAKALTRAVTWQVVVAGVDRSKDVASVEVEQDLAGSLPPGTRLVEGVPSRKATVVLVGRDPMVALHPARSGTTGAGDVSLVQTGTASVSLGFEQENLEQITGDVLAATFRTVTGGDGQVELEVVDPVRGWHAPLTLPAAGPIVRSDGAARAPMRSSAVITHVANLNGQRVTPAPLASPVTTMVSLPLVGGAVPELGAVTPWQDDGTGVDMTWLAGPYGPAWARTVTVDVAPANAGAFNTVNRIVWIECWVYVRGGYGITDISLKNVSNGREFRLRVQPDSEVEAAWIDDGFVLSEASVAAASGAGAWVYCAASLHSTGSTVTVRAHRDGTTSTATFGQTATADTWTVFAVLRAPVQALQVHRQDTTTTTPPWRSPTPITPAASFADGDLMWVLPEVYREDSWDVLRRLAAAELGSLDFDGTGRLRYRSRAQIAALPATVQREFLVEDTALDDVEWELRADRVRTAAAVAFTQPQWRLYTVPSDGVERGDPPYLLDRVLIAPPGTSTHYLETGRRLTGVTGFGIWISSTPRAQSGIVFATSEAPTVAASSAGYSVTLQQLSQRRFVVTVVNNSGVTLYSAWPSSWGDGPYGLRTGYPAMILYGTVAVGDEPILAEASTGAGTLPVRQSQLSEWRQDAAAAAAQAAAIVTDLATPVPVLRGIRVSADPRLELLDVVRVATKSGKVRPVTGRIVKIVRTLDEGGLLDVLDLAAAAE